MDLKQLEAFVYVVKLNSFSKAADTIYLSQPTISAHISSLEKELGTQLLVRSTKEVYPTKVGVEFFSYAQNMLALRDQAIQSVSGLGHNSRGEISVLSSSVPAQYLLPEIVTAFRRRYPNIIIRVHQSNSNLVSAKLGNCYYDVGIVGTKIQGNKFIQEPFCDDTLVFVYPADLDIDEAIIGKNLVDFIRSQPFIMRETGSGTLQELDRYLKKHDLSLDDLKPACYMDSTQGVMQAVSSGMGISFLSKAATALYVQMGLVKTIEVDHQFFLRRFYLLLKKDMVLSPVQKLLVDFIAQYYYGIKEPA